MPKCQRKTNKVMGATGPVTKEAEVKEEDQVMEVDDMKEPETSLLLGLRVEAMR